MKSVKLSHFLLTLFAVIVYCHAAMLYPRKSETRQIQELGGMWNFRADFSSSRHKSFDEKWYSDLLSKTGPVMDMPVPSSYNDITTDRKLQNFVGWVWYDQEFYGSEDWNSKRVVLRIDSAHYYSIVWLNGLQVMSHEGGHLPFEVEVTDLLPGSNRVTLAINNTLSPHTLPPGTLTFHTDNKQYPPGYFVQNLQFDFFNYAGVHRRVRLYTTPKTYIRDINIKTTIVNDNKATVAANVMVAGPDRDNVLLHVDIIDRDGKQVVHREQGAGQNMNVDLPVDNPHLWWPYTMNTSDAGYLYTLKVQITSETGRVVDVYRQPFGIRSISVTQTQILINSQPFYCHGVAKHEDSDIRGKGLDFPLIARDFHMLKWLGVNCFRTSHYPYAEEIMDQADKQGIVVIDECPGVGIKTTENFSNRSLSHHLDVMSELVTRDKNRPSVIMWSVANEPTSSTDQAEHYFKEVIDHTRKLDPTRLVTFVSSSDFSKDKVAKYTDVQCINRYYGWYEDTGHLETIPYKLRYDLDNWYATLKKPLLITEYGADTVPGLHTEPSYVFTEEYQVDFLTEYHRVFDELRHKYLAGEMVWNFADFMTDATVSRVVGNKKGLLTRQRQPKAAAHLIRRRYWNMISGTPSVHDEL